MKRYFFILLLSCIVHFQTYSQSMPQLLGNSPLEFVGSELAVITLKTTPETLKALVPEPLVSNSDNLLTIAIGVQKIPKFLDYHEMYIAVPSAYNGKTGGYIPLLYLDEAALLCEVCNFALFKINFYTPKRLTIS